MKFRMFWTPFKKIPKECLGVDIGTSSIKIVEIRKRGKEKELGNYGEIKIRDIYPDFKKNSVTAESEEIAKVIGAILAEAKIKTKAAVFSLPDYSSFFTTFTLPAMTREEIPEAVKFEAPIRIPLPLAKVTLDWQVVEGFEKESLPLRILLVAVPNEIVDRYREIASLAKLDLMALEAEVFGLVRTLVKTGEPAVLVDIGRESTTCSIIDKKILKASHSFDTGGRRLTEAVSQALNLQPLEAEDLKEENGILGDEAVKESLIPTLDLILEEIKQVCNNFLRDERTEVEKLILTGGSALLPGLKEYCESSLNLKAEIGNPFSGIVFPSVLAKTLEKMGPIYAVSVGMALRELK